MRKREQATIGLNHLVIFPTLDFHSWGLVLPPKQLPQDQVQTKVMTENQQMHVIEKRGPALSITGNRLTAAC